MSREPRSRPSRRADASTRSRSTQGRPRPALGVSGAVLHVGHHREAAEHLAFATRNLPNSIAEKAKERLFERFTRPRSTSSSCGWP